jgi:hypothetical protein
VRKNRKMGGLSDFERECVSSWGHYATSRNVAGSRPDEVNEFSSIYLILPAALGPEAVSPYNRNEYQKQKNNVFE